MSNPNKSYRIRTEVGSNAPNVIHVPFNQTYDMFEILSLKLGQVNSYKSFDSDYGVLVGRVIANGGFGIPNAKVSVFISVDSNASFQEKLIYNFSSVFQKGTDDVRYNLLPEDVDNDCHQGIGTFPSKTKMLDDNTTIETFDKYWKYTTTTNNAGDYMLFGIPTGTQQVHVDIDLSDCGILSQRPHDMIGKGYNLNMFESPNQFKKSKDIDSLAQVITQNRSVYIYPYWGDITEGQDKFSLTRCDIEVDYKFESFAIFIGSIMTDKPGNAIGKNCTANANLGKMSDLTTGEGSIEMIRKTIDGKVEEFQIDGNRLIDGDGVWCYPIPMNLDYVKTDEFGTMVPTDNPNKGIATRARVRFRISLDDELGDTTAMKRAKYLVPNNPRIGDEAFDDTHEPDFEFGSLTKEESYRDLLWNNVYSVKSYIPKLQKTRSGRRREHTGIKLINHYGDNNPMPYNTLKIKLGLGYVFMCSIIKIIVALVRFVNILLSIIGIITGTIYNFVDGLYKAVKWIKPLGRLVKGVRDGFDAVFFWECIKLDSNFCDDGINPVVYYPGCGTENGTGWLFDNAWKHTKRKFDEEQKANYPNPEDYKANAKYPSNRVLELHNCIETQLAQGNDAISFDFANDWVNGTLYAPLWYRKITPKKYFFFNLIKKEGKDEWCSSNFSSNGLHIVKSCAVSHNETKENYKNTLGQDIKIRRVDGNKCDDKCHFTTTYARVQYGVIKPKKTFIGQTVYYYVPVEWDKLLDKNEMTQNDGGGEVKLVFATDLILLGNLNACNINGTPQLFRYLTSTTYNMSTDVLFNDWDFQLTVGRDGKVQKSSPKVTSEASGNDIGNPNEFGVFDGGLFYSIDCTESKLFTKSCINLARICEYGVSLDETKEVPDLDRYANDSNATKKLVADGFISWDELYNSDQRSMFATMNMKPLQAVQNTINGLSEYDFSYLYIDNFDGSLYEIMKERTHNYPNRINYKNNYHLEQPNKDYYLFRMGDKPYFYDSTLDYLTNSGNFNGFDELFDKMVEGMKSVGTNRFPRYENSFYFYFGLKSGKTAIDKFNSRYFAECKSNDSVQDTIDLKVKPNSWCSDLNPKGVENLLGDGYVTINCPTISTPYKLKLTNTSIGKDKEINFDNVDFNETKIYVSDKPNTDLAAAGFAYKKPECYNVEVNNKTQKICKRLHNGFYRATIEDADGSMFDFTFNLTAPLLNFKANAQPFTKPTKEMLAKHSKEDILSNKVDFENKNKCLATRAIGGVISICDVYIPDKDASFKVTIKNKKNPKEGTCAFNVIDGVLPTIDENTQSGSKKGLLAVHKDTATGLYSFAVGVSKGNVEYEIQITQVCEFDVKEGSETKTITIDTKNVSTTTILVKEPLPPKLLINNVDYDLLTKFDNNTGWEIKGKIDKANSGMSFVKKGLNMSNPWFHVDNVFGNTKFYNINEIRFERAINAGDKDKYVGVGAEGETELKCEELRKEFCKQNVDRVPYSWVDEYVVDDSIADGYNLVEDANKALQLRKSLPAKMYNAFFIVDKQDGGRVNSVLYADSNIYKITTIYHPEEYVSENEESILTSNDVVIVENNDIANIQIPNITYDEENNYVPVIGTSNGYSKKPFSIGSVTSSGSTKPTNTNGGNLEHIGSDFDIQLDYRKVNTQDLFNFPLIDMIMKLKFAIWLPISNFPKFMAGANNEYVTLDGFVAGNITNGVADNNEFAVQTIDNKKIVISNDYMDKTTTYVSQRVICGYAINETLSIVKEKLLNLISLNYVDDVCAYLNHIYNINVSSTDNGVTTNNVIDVINTLSLRDDSVIMSYKKGQNKVEHSIALSSIEETIFPFVNYRAANTSKVASARQYCVLTSKANELKILDSERRGEKIVIDDIGSIVLVNAENVCSTTKQSIQVETTKKPKISLITYSVITINLDGSNYPINKANKAVNNLSWQISDVVSSNSAYSISNPQNIYSIATTNELLTAPDKGIIDSSFGGLSQGEMGLPEKTKGISTMGVFEFDNSEHKPFFIVASTDSVRTISPVYHFADVEVVIKYGNKTSNGNTKKCVAISVKENPNNHYFNEYDFYIEGNVGNIVIAKERIKPKEYLYKELSDSEYNSIANDVVNASKNTKVILTDCVGVKHKCKITKSSFVQTTI